MWYLGRIKNGGLIILVLGGYCGFLTGDLDIRVIHYVIDYTILPQGRYPESFVFISLLKVCQKGAFVGVLGGYSGFLTADFDERFINYCH